MRAGGRQEMSGAPGVVNKPVETERLRPTVTRHKENTGTYQWVYLVLDKILETAVALCLLL